MSHSSPPQNEKSKECIVSDTNSHLNSIRHRARKDPFIHDIIGTSGAAEGDTSILLERASHLDSERTSGVGWDEDEAIFGVVNNHIVRAEPTIPANARDEDQKWRDEISAFHKENLGKAWERARESVHQAEMLAASKSTQVPSTVSPQSPHENYAEQLKHNYSDIPSPSVIMEKSPAIVTQAVDLELQDDTIESYPDPESVNSMDFAPAVITPPDMTEEPEQAPGLGGFSDSDGFYPGGFSDSEEFYPDEFSDFEEAYPEKEFSDSEEYFELGGDFIEAGEGVREAEEELIESEELLGPEELFEPEELPESRELLDSKDLSVPNEISTDDPSDEKTILTGISAPTFRTSHYRPTKNFGSVLAKAVGLGLLMAIPSLIMMCALSRKGQYIWIRTVNMSDLILPTSEHVRYEGGSGPSPNLSSMTTISRDDSEMGGIMSRRNIPSTDSSDILDRRSGTIPEANVLNNLGSLDISGIGSRHGIESTHRSILATTDGAESADRSGAGGSGLFLGSIGPVPVKRPWVFQRWFGWGSEPRDGLGGTPQRTTSTKRSRTISRDRTPDPDLVTEVCERLIRERMNRLSTVTSAGEEEGSGDNEVGESLPTQPARALVTGSASGTRGGSMKRNPQGILKAPGGGSNGPDAPGEHPIASGSNNTREESHADGEDSEGGSFKGKGHRLVRFDGSADKVYPQARGTFERDPVRRCLNPTVEDDISPAEETLPLDDNTLEVSDGTVIRKERKGERIGGMWGTVFSDPMTTSTDSMDSEEMGAILEQPNRDGEYKGSSRGASFDDDSTLTENSNDEVVIVDSQMPMMEEGHRPGPKTHGNMPKLNVSGGRALVLDPSPGSVDTSVEGMDDDTNVVSAFGMRAESPVWDSQTSDGSLLSESFFTETNSSDHVSIDDVANSIL